jgi:hypothetical protein
VGEHEGSVAESVTAKLSDDEVPEQIASLILDAMRGCAPEAGAGGGGHAVGSKRVYLKSISVEGFRGIGPRAALHLTPGPGLAVVSGRTGRASQASPRRRSSRWPARTSGGQTGAQCGRKAGGTCTSPTR